MFWNCVSIIKDNNKDISLKCLYMAITSPEKGAEEMWASKGLASFTQPVKVRMGNLVFALPSI